MRNINIATMAALILFSLISPLSVFANESNEGQNQDNGVTIPEGIASVQKIVGQDAEHEQSDVNKPTNNDDQSQDITNDNATDEENHTIVDDKTVQEAESNADNTNTKDDDSTNVPDDNYNQKTNIDEQLDDDAVESDDEQPNVLQEKEKQQSGDEEESEEDTQQQDDTNTVNKTPKTHEQENRVEEDSQTTPEAEDNDENMAVKKARIALKIRKVNTDKLAHIKLSNAVIYKHIGHKSSSFHAGNSHMGKVYYVKKKAAALGNVYYLLSTKASSTSGVIGWINKKDVTWHSREVLDWKTKYFSIKGTGKGYKRSWGGSKEVKMNNLSKYQGKQFTVGVTVRVGRQIWYRGKVGGHTLWIHENNLFSIRKVNTDKLAHIKRKSAILYKEIGNKPTSFHAGNSHMNKVYYVKKKAAARGNVYYLLSTKASSTRGVIGWINKKDVTWHTREVLDWKTKYFNIKGTGKGYKRSWGGSKEIKMNNLSKYQGKQFIVGVTVRVGRQIWYRGKVGGHTLWIHENNLFTIRQADTDKLAHIKKNSAIVYKEIGNELTSFNAKNLTGKVYYVKKEANALGNVYYLLSTKASSTNGVVGWIKKDDTTWLTREVLDWNTKHFYIKGTGKGYKRSWGGNKEIKEGNLSKYQGQSFTVGVTVKVGKELWYRGKVSGKTLWIKANNLSDISVVTTKYDKSLAELLQIQKKTDPQTDSNYAYVSKKFIDDEHRVTSAALNVRPAPNTDKDPIGVIYNMDRVTILGEANGFYQIEYKHHGWVNANDADILYYLDPSNFYYDPKQVFQFLDLSRPSGISKKELNDFLKGKGILEGQGQAFIDAANKYQISDLYLISHALLETGNGQSELAQGTEYNGKTVYNVFGYGAYDSCPIECGTKAAYNNDWTTPYKAIVGGAEHIGKNYIKAGQNTLYEMRWNPQFSSDNGYASHQYATDIGWASKQIYSMYNLYQELEYYNLTLDIPVFK